MSFHLAIVDLLWCREAAAAGVGCPAREGELGAEGGYMVLAQEEQRGAGEHHRAQPLCSECRMSPRGQGSSHEAESAAQAQAVQGARPGTGMPTA